MSHKRKLLHELMYRNAESLWNRSGDGGAKKTLKRIIVGALVAGSLLLVLVIVLVGYLINAVGSKVTINPDADLVALRRSIEEKTIVLTEAQKKNIAPLLDELARNGQASAVKEKIWPLLEETQRKAVTEWKAKTTAAADAMVRSGTTSVQETIGRLTGMTSPEMRRVIDGMTAWWRLHGPQPSNTGELRKAVEGKPDQ